MYPAVAELKREGYTIQAIDVEVRPSLAEEYNVWYLPTFVYILDGEEVRRIGGATSKEKLRRMWRSPNAWF